MIYDFHGMTKINNGDSQFVYICPFCNSKKFYVNKTNNLWDCKVCKKSGSYLTFLRDLYKISKIENKLLYNIVTEEKGIKRSTLIYYGLAYNKMKKSFILPVYDIFGRITNLRYWNPGGKWLSSVNTKNYIGGFTPDNIDAYKKIKKVIIAEGEWDGLAAKENIIDKNIFVTWVQGSGSFKSEFIEIFNNKDVTVIFDNDHWKEKNGLWISGGIEGENRIYKLCKNSCSNLNFVHWPYDKKDGYDLRDYFQEDKGFFKDITKYIQDFPRKLKSNKEEEKKERKKLVKKSELDHNKIYEGFKKWLYLENTEMIDVMFGAIFANKLDSEPVWLFLVAPPSGMKSVLIQAISANDFIYPTTTLTPHSLISGFSNKGHDPSLIPLLDQKVLAIKDFTTILDMPILMRDEIFGILRDAYDGETSKNFGNGVFRSYKSKFGIIAGVTHAIDKMADTSLGERFLKYKIKTPDNFSPESTKIIYRAINNISFEEKMKKELSEVSNLIIDNRKVMKPEIPENLLHQIICMGKMLAILRTTVNKDRFSGDVLYKPFSESATRIIKQLVKMALGIGIFKSKSKVDESEIKILRSIIMDSIPTLPFDIFKLLYDAMPGSINTKKIAEDTRMPLSTCSKILQDLYSIKVLNKDKTSVLSIIWKIDEKMLDLIKQSKLFEKES